MRARAAPLAVADARPDVLHGAGVRDEVAGVTRTAIDSAVSSDSTLAITNLLPGDRAERDARAVAYLRRSGNADLIEVLGLDGDEPRAGSPLSATCPTCGAAPGARCRKQYTEGTKARHHTARYRVAGRVVLTHHPERTPT